jgi:hypothetical protein
MSDRKWETLIMNLYSRDFIKNISEKINLKQKEINELRNAVWLPSDKADIEINEIELRELQKVKLERQVFQANVRLKIVDMEYQRDIKLGIHQSPIEKEQYENTRNAIISVTGLLIKHAADVGIIPKDKIKYYSESVESDTDRINYSQEVKKTNQEDTQEFLSQPEFCKKYIEKKKNKVKIESDNISKLAKKIYSAYKEEYPGKVVKSSAFRTVLQEIKAGRK